MSQRWSYQVVEIKPGLLGHLKAEEVQAELNRQGNDGWELVNMVSNSQLAHVQLIFKQGY